MAASRISPAAIFGKHKNGAVFTRGQNARRKPIGRRRAASKRRILLVSGGHTAYRSDPVRQSACAHTATGYGAPTHHHQQPPLKYISVSTPPAARRPDQAPKWVASWNGTGCDEMGGAGVLLLLSFAVAAGNSTGRQRDAELSCPGKALERGSGT
ncbi:hypothetical protein MAPG_09016 [Magnaporthiopsis poae ATCC 64411]|uniref:Uncharacterized protein n=1 Tax=Magnaporthiopsis poae (strain ATCC 64411 / 73-15) TaxID=644358 RepID=A0A0C4E8U8_MAGP6|nr:hypothetical protein MAPG_09016 [Magnaporthiopsis poae ATCC 64411]